MQIPDQIQLIQTAYRRRILECWNIPAGARVLEVGCGQGDMTTVLAEAVGPTGHVTATDLASRDYGTPLNLGQATDLIKASELGDRIDFRFECDITDPHFEDENFDVAVMVHCSWYFDNAEQLTKTLNTLSKKAKTLCFAEWDSVPRSLDQIPHQMAVSIQGYLEAFKPESQANVRSPFSVNQLRTMIEECGWVIAETASPHTGDLQDADWEIAESLSRVQQEMNDPTISAKRLCLLEGQRDTLRQIALPRGNAPLNSVCFVAQVK